MSLNALYFSIGSAVVMALGSWIALLCWEVVLRSGLKWLPWIPSRKWVIPARVLYWVLFAGLLTLCFLSLRNMVLGASPEAFLRTMFLGVGFYAVVTIVRGFVRRWANAPADARARA